MLKFLSPEVTFTAIGLVALFVLGAFILCSGLWEEQDTAPLDTSDTSASLNNMVHPFALAGSAVLV